MDNYRMQEPYAKQGLYDPQFEHENCGIGAVVNMSGKTDRKVVDSALRIVETLEHRAGKDAEGKTGDGVGILLQISHTYFSKVAKEMGMKIGGKREYGIGMFFFPQTKDEDICICFISPCPAKVSYVNNGFAGRKSGTVGLERGASGSVRFGKESICQHAAHHAGIYQKTGRL